MPAADAEGPARCFELRRVNPFLGVVTIIETEGARALSLDGTHWQVEVLAHPPRGLWSGEGDSDQLQYFRFGDWTETEGLRRVPLNPILDLRRMLAASDTICSALAANQRRVPFPLAEELEQWLLDTEGQPLALIATTPDARSLAEAGAREWSAGGRGERAFDSGALTRDGTTPPDRLGQVGALERLIRDSAGPQPQTQWFRREVDARIGLEHGAPPELAGRTLPDAAFPALMLRTTWPDAAAAALVADYIAWLSPYLLTLPWLDDAIRAELEHAAVHHAVVVDAIWRLYPKVVEPELLAQARVEAKLRRANP